MHAELRTHMALFGDTTPTETNRLQASVVELQRVQKESEDAMDSGITRIFDLFKE